MQHAAVAPVATNGSAATSIRHRRLRALAHPDPPEAALTAWLTTTFAITTPAQTAAGDDVRLQGTTSGVTCATVATITRATGSPSAELPLRPLPDA